MQYLNRLKSALISLCVPLLLMLFYQPVFGQIENRVIPFPEWVASFDQDEDQLGHKVELVVVEIKVDGQPVTLGQMFQADENWLKHMTLLVKNVSNRPITSFGIGGGLLHGVIEKLLPQQSFPYGIAWSWGKFFDPKKIAYRKGNLRPEEILNPGQTVTLSYKNVDEDTLKILAEHGEGTFGQLFFMAPSIQYIDGTLSTRPGVKFNGSIVEPKTWAPKKGK